jgi:hypothetical protein
MGTLSPRHGTYSIFRQKRRPPDGGQQQIHSKSSGEQPPMGHPQVCVWGGGGVELVTTTPHRVQPACYEMSHRWKTPFGTSKSRREDKIWWILEKQDGRLWTAFIWLRHGSRARWWIFGFHERQDCMGSFPPCSYVAKLNEKLRPENLKTIHYETLWCSGYNLCFVPGSNLGRDPLSWQILHSEYQRD